jgi:hypothetical protein
MFTILFKNKWRFNLKFKVKVKNNNNNNNTIFSSSHKMTETGRLLRVLAIQWQLSNILEFSHGFEKILQDDYHIIWCTLEFRVPSNKFQGYLKVTAKLSIKILLVINRVIFSLTIYRSHVGWRHSRGVKI